MRGTWLTIPDGMNVINRADDKARIEGLMGKRFLFSYGRLNAAYSLEKIDCFASDTAFEDAFQGLREKYLLYGKCFLVGALRRPYLALDMSDAAAFFDEFLSCDCEFWVCDAGFRWCVEIRSNGNIAIQKSPWRSLVDSLERRSASREPR